MSCRRHIVRAIFSSIYRTLNVNIDRFEEKEKKAREKIRRIIIAGLICLLFIALTEEASRKSLARVGGGVLFGTVS